MGNRSLLSKQLVWFACLLPAFLLLAGLAAAKPPQEPEKKPEEESKVASIEVTPAKSTAAIGTKLQFKAVAEDANGQPLPDLVKHWHSTEMPAS